MYQVLMVEDDEGAADALSEHIRRYGVEARLEFKLTRFDSAAALMKARKSYDLVFMDIDLPGINGMEAAELLRTYDVETPIIFVTNLAQYAIRGYEVNALDFIVKPVTYHHFSMRMDKAMRAVARNRKNRVSIATRSGVRVLQNREIVYVETKSHDLVFHLVDEDGDGQELRVRGTLSSLEERLSHTSFVRISSGCLANMDHIRSMRSGEISMDNGQTLYASRAKKRAVLETFTDYLGGSI